MNQFEKSYESILKEYKQLDESLGKAVKNFFKHPTGKGKGDEVVKTFTSFTKEYNFKQSNKHKDLYVKKIDQFEIGLKLTFNDGTKTSFGTVYITVVDRKEKKYLAQDQQIQLKHSFTLEEFTNLIQKFLTNLNDKLILSRTDMSVDDEEDVKNDSSDKKRYNTNEQLIVDKLIKHGVDEKNVDEYLKIFIEIWNNIKDDDQKEVIRKLIGI